MKKMIVAVVLMTLLLSACGGIKADVPDNDEAKAIKAVVEQYMSANETYDADLLMSLYSDELVWMDYGLNDGPLTKGTLAFFVQAGESERDYKIEFDSYLIASYGGYAVIQGEFSMPAKSNGKWASAPFVCVLEFRDGLIVNETWYYNADPFH